MFYNVSNMAPTGEICGMCPDCNIPFVVYQDNQGNRVFVCISCDILYLDKENAA